MSSNLLSTKGFSQPEEPLRGRGEGEPIDVKIGILHRLGRIGLFDPSDTGRIINKFAAEVNHVSGISGSALSELARLHSQAKDQPGDDVNHRLAVPRRNARAGLRSRLGAASIDALRDVPQSPHRLPGEVQCDLSGASLLLPL